MADLIVVVGGGYAGCAAAVTLAQCGHPVVLHESAATLGGRARRVQRNGLPLDNGQHLLLGAYSATRRLAATLHAGEEAPPFASAPLAIQPFARHQRNAFSLRARSLPAPFGLLAGLLHADGLDWRERIAAVRWFARLKRLRFRCAPGATVAALLDGLPGRVRDNLWAPICLAALNTPPQRASAQVFANVLRAAFDADADAALLLAPRVDLGDVIPERAAHWLRERGHDVRTRSPIVVAGWNEQGVTLRDRGGDVAASAVIVAVGPHQLAAAFDTTAAAGDAGVAAALLETAALAYEPITTAYLGYGAAFPLPAGLVRLDDAPGQWIFDRADILARALPAPERPDLRSLFAVAISAGGAHDALDHQGLAFAIDAQLRRLAQALPPLAWSQVIEEKRATYACTPALARPAAGKLAPRIYIAGDYTYAPFPATLEAAVRSGETAAHALVRDWPA